MARVNSQSYEDIFSFNGCGPVNKKIPGTTTLLQFLQLYLHLIYFIYENLSLLWWFIRGYRASTTGMFHNNISI